MNKYAVVENGVVTNVILWNGIAQMDGLPTVYPIVDEIVDIGYTYVDGVFSPPIN